MGTFNHVSRDAGEVAGIRHGPVLRGAVHWGNGVEPQMGCRSDQVSAEIIRVDAAKPGRAAGLAGLKEVLVGQGDRANLGVLLLDEAQ